MINCYLSILLLIIIIISRQMVTDRSWSRRWGHESSIWGLRPISIRGKIWSECVYCARSVEYVMDKKNQRRFNCSTGDVLDVLCRQSRMKGMRQKKMFGFEIPWLSHWINNFKKGKELSLTFKEAKAILFFLRRLKFVFQTRHLESGSCFRRETII